MSAQHRTHRAKPAWQLQPLLAAVFVAGLARSAFPQSTSNAPWAGWAQCRLTTQGEGYSNQQTQTWTTTGGAPTVQGALRMHPATWSVTGSGSLRRTQGSQTLTARWTANAQGVSAPISVVVRASDGRRLIRSGHAQLRQPKAVVGTQTVSIDGKPQSSVPVAYEVFEFTFPTIEDSAASTRMSGSKTSDVAGSVGFMQPGGARTSATCAWDFAQGGGAAPVPSP
ncbi:MAG: hypothetical protein JWL95_1950 [Gemmatimonadetes bacterium]|nr:hypothetical protein [Gemmatimonadota bacterium]